MTKRLTGKRRVRRLDGGYLVLITWVWPDRCRAEVWYSPSGRADDESARDRTMIMIQRGSSHELAIATIGRDLTTYAMRALAMIPSIGLMEQPPR